MTTLIMKGKIQSFWQDGYNDGLNHRKFKGALYKLHFGGQAEKDYVSAYYRGQRDAASEAGLQ